MRNNSWIALTMGMIVVFSSLCFAAIPSSSIALGDVKPGDDVKVAEYKFGIPKVQEEKFYFANGVVVEVDESGDSLIEEISTKSSSVKTPAGVCVGMNEYVLNDHYGTADKVEIENFETEYKYISTDKTKKMTFTVIDGVIRKIECENRKAKK